MSGYSLSYKLPSGFEKAFYWTLDRADAQNYILRVMDIFGAAYEFFVTTNGARQAATEFLGAN